MPVVVPIVVLLAVHTELIWWLVAWYVAAAIGFDACEVLRALQP